MGNMMIDVIEEFAERNLPFAERKIVEDGEMVYLYTSTPYISYEATKELGMYTMFSGIRLGKYDKSNDHDLGFTANVRIEWIKN